MPKITESSKKKQRETYNYEIDTMKEIKEEMKQHDEGVPKISQLTICAEEHAPKGQTYILKLCASPSEADSTIAAAFSNNLCAVYSIGETLSKSITLAPNDSPIVGIKFSPLSKHILYTATRDGIITVCDLRAKGKVISTIRDTPPDGKFRPFASFDVSSDDRLVVAGSEHVGGDAFIFFWDLRYNGARTEGKNQLLGGYWESHMDDVTALSFHPSQVDLLISGSTDGLINVFDLTKNNEESALKYSLNTESSVDTLGWLDNGKLWCTTHTHQLQLWDCEDAEPYGKFDRNVIGSSMSMDLDTSYVVKVHNINRTEREPLLIAGSTAGTSKGQLGGLRFADGNLQIYYNFIGNKQLVRDSLYDEKSDRFITGGEMGIINVWKESKTPTKVSANINGGKVRERQSSRAKPY